MALDTPVVATSKGDEGLDVVPGEDILITDRPDWCLLERIPSL
jgi:hypothetical protein